jgi:hypothetical protein
VLTDTHFKERNRMARFVAFLAQSQAAIENPPGRVDLSWNDLMHGIAVDEGTALIVDVATGKGTVQTTDRSLLGLPGYVFFGTAEQGDAVVFDNNGRLGTSKPADIVRLGVNQSFDLTNWTPAPGAVSGSFEVKITDGRAQSKGLLMLPDDLYYSLSSLDPRLLAEQISNREYIP